MGDAQVFPHNQPDEYVSTLKQLEAAHAVRRSDDHIQKRLVRFEDRRDTSVLTNEEIINQAKGRHLLQWRGIPQLKSTRDLCITRLMLQEIKPSTIIEIGTFTGGNALWMVDLMMNHGTKSHVYTMDIDLSYVHPIVKERDDITVIQGDCHKIEKAFPVKMLERLPHPWYIAEDAHCNLPAVLGYLTKFTHPGDYLVVEDTHPGIYVHAGFGLLEGLEYKPVGTSKRDEFKVFMEKHGSKYRVDTGYTDIFGYNGTWNCNSILRRV